MTNYYGSYQHPDIDKFLYMLDRRRYEIENSIKGKEFYECHTVFGYYRINLRDMLFSHQWFEIIKPLSFYGSSATDSLIYSGLRDLVGHIIADQLVKDVLQDYITIIKKITGLIRFSEENKLDFSTREAEELYLLNNGF